MLHTAFKSSKSLLIYSPNTNQFMDGGPRPLFPLATDSPLLLLHQSALPFMDAENGDEEFPVLFSAQDQ